MLSWWLIRRISSAEKESAAYGNDSLSGTLYEGDAVPLPLCIFCGETRDDEHASAHGGGGWIEVGGRIRRDYCFKLISGV